MKYLKPYKKFKKRKKTILRKSSDSNYTWNPTRSDISPAPTLNVAIAPIKDYN